LSGRLEIQFGTSAQFESWRAGSLLTEPFARKMMLYQSNSVTRRIGLASD
jgi:hypothetical protein